MACNQTPIDEGQGMSNIYHAKARRMLNASQTLYFSHGFSPVFKDLTKVDVPTDIEYVLFGVIFPNQCPLQSSKRVYDTTRYSPFDWQS